MDKPHEIKKIKNPYQGKSVKDFMTKKPTIVSPKMTVKEAAQIMRSLDTGSLPVGDDKKLLGFITDRDIVVRAISEELDPNTTQVEKIMTKEVLYCFEDNDPKAVVQNMKDNKILRLMVLDNNKLFKGVITHSQLAKAAIETNNHELCTKITELSCYDKIS